MANEKAIKLLSNADGVLAYIQDKHNQGGRITTARKFIQEALSLLRQPKEKREHIGWYYPERDEFNKIDFRHENAVPVYAIEEIKGNEEQLVEPKCKTCGGTGWIKREVDYKVGHETYKYLYFPCDCPPAKPKCETCEGSGQVPKYDRKGWWRIGSKPCPDCPPAKPVCKACLNVPWKLCPVCHPEIAAKPEGEFTKLFQESLIEAYKGEAIPADIYTQGLEACDRIDQWEARYYDVTEGMMKKEIKLIQELAGLKAQNTQQAAEIGRLKRDIGDLHKELMRQAKQFHSPQYCKCNWCQMAIEQALKEKKDG